MVRRGGTGVSLAWRGQVERLDGGVDLVALGGFGHPVGIALPLVFVPSGVDESGPLSGGGEFDQGHVSNGVIRYPPRRRSWGLRPRGFTNQLYYPRTPVISGIADNPNGTLIFKQQCTKPGVLGHVPQLTNALSRLSSTR